MSWSRRDILRTGAQAAAFASAGAAPGVVSDAIAAPSVARLRDRPNILSIAVDDMNDWTGFLGGYPTAKTPNLDGLARRGAAMTRAYSNVPICQASRSALLFGKASWNTGNYTNDNRDWPHIKAFDGRASLIRCFKDQGYKTIGTGKTFHAGWSGRDGLEAHNDPQAWSDFQPLDRFIRSNGGDKTSYGPKFEIGQTSDDLRADWAVRNVFDKRHDRPFFMAYGANKPHQPWVVPQAYFDMHPRDRLVYPLGALDTENHRFGENADIADLPKAGRVMARQLYDWHLKYKADEGRWLDAVQAYLAACSCADHAIGVLLDGLAKGPNASNTIVVVWSDHGFQLGEKLSWLKHTLWERALRIPVVIAGPGIAAGRREDAFSTLDVYPTLCALAGVDAPSDLDGFDQTPMIRGDAAGARDIALSAWALDLEDGLSVADGANWREDVHLSGRTKTHRLIRYGNGDLELYDHRDDPWEWRNVAERAENRELIERLSAQMPRPRDYAVPAAPEGPGGGVD